MSNKFTLMLEGAPYEVERRGALMVVNGVEFSYGAQDSQVLIGGAPHLVKLQAGFAEVDGIRYAIDAQGLEEAKGQGKTRKAASAGAAEAAGAVTAIMPGLIIKVLKAEGDRVQAGETVLILEAMKMQNEITAKVSGTVRQLCIKQGDNVEMRQVLCVIE